MTDDRKSDDERTDAEGIEEGGDAPEPPRPQTWAGRARAEAESPEEPEGTGADADEGGHEEADEREEPPDEFEFAEEDESEEEPDAEAEVQPEADVQEEPEAEADEEPAAEVDDEPESEAEAEVAETEAEEPEKPGQDTVEVDTLAIADREAEQEAAHAGLKARAEKSAAERVATSAERVATSGAQAAVAGAVAALPDEGTGEPPKRSVWWRFLAGSFVVIASTAAATAIAFLLYLTDIGNDLKGDDQFAAAVERTLSDVDGGEPQTILILGSDKRSGASGDPGRSDTTMLLRVDPDKEFLSLLSLPRDLQVEIPGYGTDKLNAAYSIGEQEEAESKGETGGGPELTLRTVKNLLGIDINHIVNINFEGFYDAINAIGCVYIDVDRHYFNPVGGEYDDIDIESGYTKLCGYRALDYVRYRHNDNDLVRGARQQAFVREARQQIPPRDLLPFLPNSHGDELIKIFTKYTTSDIDDAPTIIEMLKTFVEVRNAPVRQVSLGELTVEGGVGASNEDIEAAVNQFLGNDLDDVPEESVEPEEPNPGNRDKDKKRPEEPDAPAMVDVTGTAQEYAAQFQDWLRDKNAGLPVFYPTAVVENINAGISEESRAHTIEPPDGVKKPYYGFKWVLPYQESFGTSYYGVAGVNWLDAPILNNPSEVRTVDGRDYLVFYEQDRVRLVGWKTDDGAYWVNNTLTRALSEDQMFAVANAVREFEG